MKKPGALLLLFQLFVFQLFFSCSLSIYDAPKSNIYLIALSNDYYVAKDNNGNKFSTLAQCDNDYYSILDQFHRLSSNIESLSFIGQFGKKYVIEGFNEDDFVRSGLCINSKPATDESMIYAGWTVPNTYEFRIGQSDMSEDEKNNPESDKWGSKLEYYTDEKGEVFLTYSDNLSVYAKSNPNDTYNEIRIPHLTEFNKPVRFSSETDDEYYKRCSLFTFYYDNKLFRDLSEYDCSLPINSKIYNGKYLSRINDDNYNNFHTFRYVGDNEKNWVWKTDKTTDSTSIVYIQDEIKKFLDSKSIKPSDIIFFYYTGHGIRLGNDENDDNGALCITDSDDTVVGIRPSTAMDLFSSYNCHKVFMIDACYSGNFVNVANSSTLRGIEKYIKKLSSNGYYFFLDSDNVFNSIFSYKDFSTDSNYKDTWVLSATTSLNTSLAGYSLYGGIGNRYSLFTLSVLNRLGFDTKYAIRDNCKQNVGRVSVFDIYKSSIEDFPKFIRQFKDEIAQNPTSNVNPVNLLIF